MKGFGLAAGLAFAVVAGAAHATTYTLVDDSNECGAGGFSACTLGGSPAIIKFSGDLGSVDDTSSLFPSVSGGEFTFSNVVTNAGGEVISFDWSYVAGTDDPGITAVVIKAGPQYAYTTDGVTVAGNTFYGSLSTLDAGLVNRRGIAHGLSHVTFFDSYLPPVPLPAGGLLLGTALAGAGLIARRRKAA